MKYSRHRLLSRAFASQSGAYVIDVGAILSPDRVPEAYRGLAVSYPGESCIIDPTGQVIAATPYSGRIGTYRYNVYIGHIPYGRPLKSSHGPGGETDEEAGKDTEGSAYLWEGDRVT
jgi:hypothetical protein